jgi:hypothetical protein
MADDRLPPGPNRSPAGGAGTRLKQVLLGGRSGAVDFQRAMARQAIDQAMHELNLPKPPVNAPRLSCLPKRASQLLQVLGA